MNKNNLIDRVSEVLNSKKEARAVIDCIIKTITQTLSENESVTLVGFDTFKTVSRKAKKRHKSSNRQGD